MTHLNSTTRLFIGILILTLLLSYIALTLGKNQKNLVSDFGLTNPQPNTPHSQTPAINTSKWKPYLDTIYPISFSYPDNWTLSTEILNKQFYKINLVSPDKTAINIYISDKNYLGLEGLKTTPYQYKNLKGVSVNDNLIGIKTGEYYYTFDAAINSTPINEFKGLMSTVEFK